MQKPIKLISVVILLLITVGCSYAKFPSVYKINIQQGNIVTQEMVDQLKPGMTERQVRYIMGNPLIEDTFSPVAGTTFIACAQPEMSSLKSV